ncbi:MAG TPA: hypothetical protein VI078_16985 [bacterium]
MQQMLRIFVVPPLLTLALVASTLVLYSNYLTFKSRKTTYVFSDASEAQPCAFCHSGYFARSWRRIAALNVRLSNF